MSRDLSGDRVRVPRLLLRRRIHGGIGASEQPNCVSDGDLRLTPLFWGAVVLTGIGAGLFGAAMMAILHAAQHLGFGYSSGSFQSAAERAPGPRTAYRVRSGGSYGHPRNRRCRPPDGVAGRSVHASMKNPARYTISDTRAPSYSANSWRLRVGHGHGSPHAVHVQAGRTGRCIDTTTTFHPVRRLRWEGPQATAR